MTDLLPTPRHSLAEKVLKATPRLEPFINSGVDTRLFLSSLIMEVNGLNPSIDVRSTLMSAMNLAIIGLIPGSSLAHAYLVPFKGRCQVIVGYQGFLELALRNKFLAICNTPQVVLRGEEFKMWSDEAGNHFHHVIPLERDIAKPNVLGAYVTYKTVAGGVDFTFVSRSEIDTIDTGRNVWRDNYPAMCCKTPIRRASKCWRKTRELGLAVMLDEQAERGEEQECPAWNEQTEEDNALTNLRRSLDATLDGRIHCTTAEERDCVVRWACRSKSESYATAYETAATIRHVMHMIATAVKNGLAWEDILNTAKDSEWG